MAKVTSKLQVTIPKAIADRYRIRPGQDLDWQPAGDVIRIAPRRVEPRARSLAARLALFDAATARQRDREAQEPIPTQDARDRGWRREDLYDRGSTR